MRPPGFLLVLLLLLPPAAPAAPGGDHAMQWPLTLSRDDAGAYSLVLDAAVYRQLQSPTLLDFEIVNRDGVALPAALMAPQPSSGGEVQRTPLPWFAVASPGGSPTEWRMLSQIDADGRLRRVEVRTDDPAPPRAGSTLLIDLSGVRDPVAALWFQWSSAQSLDIGYRIDSSDDLEHWRPLASSGRLIELRRDGRELLQRRIALFEPRPHRQRGRYLRLIPDRADAGMEITAVEAEFAEPATRSPQWLELRPLRVQRSSSASFEYDMGGRYPVQQVDVALPGNHALQWRLDSRDDERADWRLRAGPWIAYRVDGAAQGRQSAARVLDAAVRDRYWRLRASGAVEGTPALRLGYRPETVAFLAQGAPPYRLLAGSSRARREQSPLPQLVAALREQNGPSWQPAAASLGAAQVLAGDAALRPRRDWKGWLLWAVLALGAVLVAGFAVTLMRAPRDSG